ncbi:Global transcription regulator sge1 [Exophiala xenobiotica]|nr:Global transcription regulator sge1 [Exophiala xenobiotica]
MTSGNFAFQPTFQGHVATTQDALVLFEACLQGYVSHVLRRPSDRERSSLIRSGSVFVYEGNASGIKRWTDGVRWSPSRVLGNFLVYRELDQPFPPGEKKRAMSKQRGQSSKSEGPIPRPVPKVVLDGHHASFGVDLDASEIERQLIGPLVDSYEFKQGGLVKKSISVTVQGVTNHLISYYHVNDVMSNRLRTPTQIENLRYILPRTELISQQNFRFPSGYVEQVCSATGGYAYHVDTDGNLQNNPQQAQYYTPQNYPSMARYPGARGSDMRVLSRPAPYLPSPPSTSPKQAQRPGYSQFYQCVCSRGYDPSSRSLPTTPLSDRGPPHSGDMYQPLQMQRPVNSLSIVSMDSGNPVPYTSSPYLVNTAAAQMSHTRQNQPSHRQVEYGVYRRIPEELPQGYSSVVVEAKLDQVK